MLEMCIVDLLHIAQLCNIVPLVFRSAYLFSTQSINKAYFKPENNNTYLKLLYAMTSASGGNRVFKTCFML